MHLTELATQECWDLVGGRQLGRLGWQGSAGPAVLPVNYRATSDRSVWIRTGAHSAIAIEVDDLVVALEVDDIDPHSHIGWSVMIRGRAEIHYHEDQLPDEVRALETWPEGSRPLWVNLTPGEVTGRRLTD